MPHESPDSCSRHQPVARRLATRRVTRLLGPWPGRGFGLLLCSVLGLASADVTALMPPVATVAPVAASDTSSDPAAKAALDVLLHNAFGDGLASAPAGGRELFDAVLKAPVFLARAVGPFDLYVYKADGLSNAKEAQKLLDKAAAGLAATAPVMARHFGRPQGLVSGHRFPMVLCDSDREHGERGYDSLVALVDRCEDGAFSGWKPANQVWTPANLHAEVMRTWEVQVFNVAHPTIASQLGPWSEHGIGYYAVAHVSNRALRLGSWGLVPPWVGQGLIDELDIEAYGEAWVGSEAWTSQTPGWYRPGWSGFVPIGQQPPPPVTGPPADLATKVQKTGNSWEARPASKTRHWTELVADRKSAAPASFAFMAKHESFLPRDRAYARCALNLLIDVAPGDGAALLELLDREGRTPASGMPDSDPLPVVFARSLGGVPAIEAFEALPTEEMLTDIGHADIAERARALGGAGLLSLTDHRAQAQWLYGQPVDMAARTALFNLILEAEYFQQLREWELIGEHLDVSAAAALTATGKYPKTDKDRAKVSAAFRGPPRG